ncbi:MAG: hypothetical protein ABI600_09275 [Luteolibacter sp.]
MKSRFLPIVNAIGCLVLTGLVVAQWAKERTHLREIQQLQSQLVLSEQKLADEFKQSAGLEKDIAGLKESIDLTRKSSEQAAISLIDQARLTDRFQAELSAAREQVNAWEASINERDAKLLRLNSDLIATRERLNEAISKLKAAGAR